MANLDDLTNEQLRMRLMDHGLANMPVTASTRNVLIKRLRKAMAEPPKTTVRRETIHVTKYSSGDETEGSEINDKNNKKDKTAKNRRTLAAAPASRRATLAAPVAPKPIAVSIKQIVPAKTPVVVPAKPPAEAVPKTVTTRRTSGRRTPINMAAPPVKLIPVAYEPDIVEIDEDSDIEMDFIPPTQRNKSRSPSLGKSDIVTTSYKHITSSVPVSPAIAEEMQWEADDYESDTVDRELESSGGIEVSQYIPYQSPHNNMPTYKVTDITYKGDRKTAANENPENTYNYGGYQNKIPLSTVNREAPRATFSTSYNSYKPTTSNYNNTSQSRFTTAYKSSYDPNLNEEEDEYEDEGDNEPIEKRAPFLSDFTRRLSQLRAEPLRNSAIPNENAFVYRTSHRAHSRQQQQPLSDGVWGSFKNFITQLERQNRWVIWPIIIGLVALFFYVMIFTN